MVGENLFFVYTEFFVVIIENITSSFYLCIDTMSTMTEENFW